ncbi:MAG: hypothetical protein ISS65_01780 [Desulfobacterales bacterium]|uniref:Uncharacterized protein n=1 Tax=Candidatus Desulfatibia profunda TaxID=2841695 RepID=A0A8J6NQX8_9BACT|nr:hypothetical protein [Candidatus Desulfatibia profunda]MBL7178923.1 hypothetical protein [Desulfobacterales bacterium]
MAKIVDLNTYRTKAAEQRAFGPWRKRFGEVYTQNPKLADLSDRTLYILALPAEDSAVAFYELIMGILDFGTAIKFYYLEKSKQIKVMDIHLFLADQARFEMMHRLGWIGNFPCMRYSLLEMVLSFDSIKISCKKTPPELDESHPDYLAYTKLTGNEKEVLIRRLLPQALETYKKRLKL